MNDIRLIVRKEWTGFVKSDKWIFIVYGLLIIAWSVLLSTNLAAMATGAGYLWLGFFSVIISGNFSNSTFVAERMSGSLEILLTAGVSRQGILLGKVAFVIVMSSIMGAVCYVAAMVIALLRGEEPAIFIHLMPAGKALVLYGVACFMNAASRWPFWEM